MTAITVRQDAKDRRAFRVEEVADQLGVSRSTVFRLIAAGNLESIKVGAARRVTVEQLERYLAGS